MKKLNDDSILAWAIICALIGLAIWFTACTWPGIIIPPDPEPVVVECEDYPVVTVPDFISGYVLASGADQSGSRVVVVWNLSDTLQAGDDMGESLQSLLEQKYPQFEHTVYINDADDRFVFFVTKGTNNQNLLNGKMYIRYNGLRHQFSVQSQALQTIGACTCDELMELIKEYRSVRQISWLNMTCDSTEFIKQALAVIEPDSCKGGRDWLDFRHNPYTMTDSVVNLAEVAGWNFIGND